MKFKPLGARALEASWSFARVLARDSADAYEDFLDSISFYYGEKWRERKSSRERH